MAANDAIDAVRKLTASYENFIGHRVTYPYDGLAAGGEFLRHLRDGRARGQGPGSGLTLPMSGKPGQDEAEREIGGLPRTPQGIRRAPRQEAKLNYPSS